MDEFGRSIGDPVGFSVESIRSAIEEAGTRADEMRMMDRKTRALMRDCEGHALDNAPDGATHYRIVQGDPQWKDDHRLVTPITIDYSAREHPGFDWSVDGWWSLDELRRRMPVRGTLPQHANRSRNPE